MFTYIATLAINQEPCLTSWKNLQAHVRMKSSKPTEQDRNDTTILLHHPYILWHFTNHAMCLLLECTGGASVSYMESCRVSSAYSAVHVVHGEGVICECLQFHCCWAWQIGLSCMLEDVELAVLSLQCMSMCMKDVWESWWSILHSFIASSVFCGICGWQNGTRCIGMV